MGLNLIELRDVVRRLAPVLTGARIQAVRESPTTPNELYIAWFADGAERWLLVDLHPATMRLHPVAKPPRAPASPSAFVMQLRKHLDGARIERVELIEGDRIVSVAVTHHGELLELLVLLTGATADVRLVDPSGTTIGRRYPQRPDPPPAQGRTSRGLREGWPSDDDALWAWLVQTYGEIAAQRQLHEARATARTALQRRALALRRRLGELATDLNRVEGAPALRQRAELLSANRHSVVRGASTVTLDDWYAEGTPKVTLSLNPAWTVERQVDHWFSQARRHEAARGVVEARIASTHAQLAAVEGALEQIEQSDDTEQIAARANEVLPRRAAAQAHSKQVVAPRLPYHPFVSSDGLQILVGRGGADNDRTTFGVARGNDVWMHAADYPGAHVVVRLSNKKPLPRRTLEEAALLAAHFSKARNGTVIGVTWTERKHVRKPSKMAPGRVTIAGGRTIEVRADDPRLGPLLAQGSGEGTGG